MQATVIKAFNDKANQLKHQPKESTWTGTAERFQEINAHRDGPFLEAVKEAAPVKKQTKERKLKTEKK